LIGSLAFPLSAVAAPPAVETLGTVGVMPMQTDGDMPPHVREELQQRLMRGLRDPGYEVVEMENTCAFEDTQCLLDAAAVPDARFLVVGRASAEGRDYTVAINVVDGHDGSVANTVEEDCEICSLPEVGELLEEQASSLRPTLIDGMPAAAAEATPEEEPEPASTEESVTEAPVEDDKRPVNAPLFRKLGWAGLGTGVALLGAGITLLVLDDRPYKRNCSGEHIDINGTCEFRYDTVAGGATLTAIGAAAAITGTALLIVAHKRGKPAPGVQAVIGPGHIGITGRF
jgi:hypothetical protein